MKTVLNSLATEGRYSQLHIVVLACFATAVAMCVTSSDLGVMAPLIISLAFYLMFFAGFVELFLIVSLGIRKLARFTMDR